MVRKPAYVYSDEIETYNFGPDHPMKPKKVAMAHDIVNKTHLIEHMDLYKPPKVPLEQLTKFHSYQYI